VERRCFGWGRVARLRRTGGGAQPGVRCFHRFPMRGEAVGGGGFGLPHGTTSNVTARSDSAPVVGARPAFWHPVRGAGVGGGGVPGGVRFARPPAIF
jgi:hypothetical protein